MQFTEDCLVVAINVPSDLAYDESNKKIIGNLPVMVWIHGGAFMRGSANELVYNARLFADVTKTIIVNVNYRLCK